MLPMGGLLMALFVGHVIEKERVGALLKRELGSFYPLWYFTLRYIVPIALSIVMLNLVGVVTL
jgi:NSS family neurotransmitter:Na+ symporter